ncbi:MAG: hypothetical protein EOO88_31315, partial [Pedobacter sp.]
MKALGLFLILSTLMPMQGCALFGPGKPVEISRPVAEPPIQKRCRITDTQVFEIKRRGLLNRYTIKNRQ